ncbi:hypothetical protein [Weissella paramesenteroides]|uniref:Uncharacterized protein n=1 Tax=Weissella paramesenteroides ATCC 33313 TaxID=585506 RepID=C5R812_WEIPA|nr:hypothetical protein [Weissella paramesenteroides]EER75596.1 hypothetical protein HMPREF0877_0107 [Weissella paramesenteroides ATCC 33313]
MKLTYKDLLYYQTAWALEVADLDKDVIVERFHMAMEEFTDEDKVLEVGNKFRKFLNVAQELDEENN